ncbi:GIY-YIG nuclease family protein [Streptococcus sp. E24BD]|uniref:GIY-YIG nuclease family protein n=1 Tax=Streptococcus sp. E24BD TaxID=3278715 RepID=UPI00359D6860
MKHIVIVSDRQPDNIAIYREEPAFVVIAERKDMGYLKDLPQAQQAGLYILIDEDTRYIGQTTNLYQRLSIHKREKEWWTQMILFGREDGRLDKSQLDYLESRLIQDFQETTFSIKNATKGNTSWIDPTKEIQAKQVWNITQDILENIANINIFDNTISEPETLSETTPTHLSISLPDGTSIPGKSARHNHIELFKTLLHHPLYAEMIREQIVSGKPSYKQPLGTEMSFEKNGRPRCAELDTGIFLYTTLSTKDREKAILRFADKIGLDITINWD